MIQFPIRYYSKHSTAFQVIEAWCLGILIILLAVFMLHSILKSAFLKMCLLWGRTLTRPGCLIPCPSMIVPPFPLPCWPALTLHLTFRAWAHLHQYYAAFCFEETRKKTLSHTVMESIIVRLFILKHTFLKVSFYLTFEETKLTIGMSAYFLWFVSIHDCAFYVKRFESSF